MKLRRAFRSNVALAIGLLSAQRGECACVEVAPTLTGGVGVNGRDGVFSWVPRHLDCLFSAYQTKSAVGPTFFQRLS
jgi:hypothetical protein